MLGFKSRKAYYDAKKKVQKLANDIAIVCMLASQIRTELPRTGTLKLYPDLKPLLQQHNVKAGRDKVHQYLKTKDLIIKPRKNYVSTTDSKHHFRKHKNLIKDLVISKPEQVFVCDITYIRVKNKFAYLFLVTDAYSKKIMGWTINYTMKAKDGMKAIKMVHSNRRFKDKVIHHSDRGIQYCTPSYINYCKKKNMTPSMTEDLHVYENAVAERINGILKGEFGIGLGFNSLKEARAVIANSIFKYNNKRRHFSLHLLTPNFVHFNPGIKIKTYKSNKLFNFKTPNISVFS